MHGFQQVPLVDAWHTNYTAKVCGQHWGGSANGIIITLRPPQNGWHFADNIFKCIFTKKIYFVSNYIGICPLGTNRQWVNNDLDNGLLLSRQQAITWKKVNKIFDSILQILGHNELMYHGPVYCLFPCLFIAVIANNLWFFSRTLKFYKLCITHTLYSKFTCQLASMCRRFSDADRTTMGFHHHDIKLLSLMTVSGPTKGLWAHNLNLEKKIKLHLHEKITM